MDLGNVRGANPIHGLLSSSPYWKVISVIADKRSARTTSRLEFWRYPELMAQWPFAHEYEMTYSLKDGVLEVRVTITNLSNDPMPVAIGFHPYYQIPDVSRDAWTGHIPARRRVVADNRLIPTGEYRAMDIPDQFPLRGRTLDDGFIDLQRDAEGRAVFSITSGDKKIETMFGSKYPVAVVWEPNTQAGEPRPFICFEPMTGVTSAVNLAHEGKYPDLQMIPLRRQVEREFLDPRQRNLEIHAGVILTAGLSQVGGEYVQEGSYCCWTRDRIGLGVVRAKRSEGRCRQIHEGYGRREREDADTYR
jgi:aldose 1-epimerase